MKYLVPLLLVVLISLQLFAQNESEKSGKKAQNFKLPDLDGNHQELNNLIGKGPVLLSFWATWCKPCMEEISEYNKIYKDYEDKGFRLIAISTDNEKTVAKVKPFIKSKNYNFMVLLDTNSDVARKYYAQQIPYTVLIDKSGNIIYTHLGYMRGDEKKVRELVEQQISNF